MDHIVKLGFWPIDALLTLPPSHALSKFQSFSYAGVHSQHPLQACCSRPPKIQLATGTLIRLSTLCVVNLLMNMEGYAGPIKKILLPPSKTMK